jgi:hypothetical protein
MINAGPGVAGLCAQPLADSLGVGTTATTLAVLGEATDFMPVRRDVSWSSA